MIYFHEIIRYDRMIMEIRQLRYFLDIADTEHLTQSAQNLFVTQSTLSLPSQLAFFASWIENSCKVWRRTN